jgi:putative colanic acid biosynthesis UDP-glucose lipid carrier transferase
VSERISPLRLPRASPWAVGTDNFIGLFEALLDPIVLVATLWAVALIVDRGLDTSYLVLSVVVFALTFPGSSKLDLPIQKVLRDTVLNWVILFVLLVFFGWATRHLDDYRTRAVVAWFFLAPSTQIITHLGFRRIAPRLVNLQGGLKRCVIAGLNEQGVSLARALDSNPYSGIGLVGFFDDRSKNRLPHADEFPLLGTIDDLSKFVRSNRIHIIYLSLPMAKQPRILRLLEGLRDTTASIYFVPDIFVTDLIQGRMSTVSGMPVVAVCESPFVGLNGILKRASDIILALLIILLISPLLLAIAAGVKLSSPGPIIFRQRRYGLDGEEIIVWKFRSMTVTEDGDSVYTQVTKNDERLTRFGSFLRRNSLDELPQFFNVLNGGMSIVGPRPHAIAVNETYRGQIPGYMIRHKVRPGITGWAQINGFRGGDDLESMKLRVEYDLDYLRNWSLKLDLHIVLRTVHVLFNDARAY